MCHIVLQHCVMESTTRVDHTSVSAETHSILHDVVLQIILLDACWKNQREFNIISSPIHRNQLLHGFRFITNYHGMIL